MLNGILEVQKLGKAFYTSSFNRFFLDSISFSDVPPLTGEMREELAAWQALGMQTVSSFFEKLHDHGTDVKGNYLPSGEVGEICKTCNKLIEPYGQSSTDEEDEEPDPNADESDEDEEL